MHDDSQAHAILLQLIIKVATDLFWDPNNDPAICPL